ncbi:hypothetical protein [Haloarcula sp. Atlit-120R]|uniref:hypothetical protein n=1 Tax=Haloarcula sp. Atlit-120R TaxID=2282135 RepID=UPI000EF24A57|nr:hypothetical protein [Haloarcula sp. Atlit-120R]RLM32653.1 hypothetical protein DVK01_20490 [Haloarcula sp. Atlit-120R]
MRKHFYLITEHNDESRVGGISITDSRLSRASKNDETPIHQIDHEQEDFVVVGKQVALGYVDFDDEDDYENRVSDAIKDKLTEIDTEWLEKAGVAEVLEA